MNADRFHRVVEILGDAMERPAAQRRAFVERACGDDRDLLAEALDLLAQAESTSLGAVTERLGEHVARAARALGDQAPLPERIGPFRVLELLGEGGMGTVYRAEQSEPVRREVALKVVHGGLRSASARARFDAERQALAVMEHPNIARIFDAGTTEDGVAWFAMELVPGTAVTTFADLHELDVDQRIDLVVDVCRGVQHAHAKGVVHRDLKPSNILVSEIDGRPVPRIIDFGIAKAVEASGADAAMTAHGMVIGTLEYMSPEQAAGGSAPVDTRSDVYALGVILFEMVAGALPFDSHTLRSVGPIEAQRIIRDTDPPTPLRRLLTADDPARVARARRTDARALQRRLSGDLGWIVMRALEKDPERRYASASALGADLERLRRNEPVEAGPTSRRYRAARFARRHRTGVVAASAVLLALVVGAAAATTGFVRATRAQSRAEAEARRATMISDFITEMLASARPEEAQGRVITVQDVADSTLVRLERDSPFEDDPEVHASVLHALGVTYRSLGRYDLATPLFARAVELRSAALGAEDTLTLNSLTMLTSNQAQGGDPAGAIASGFELVAARERAHGREHPEYVSALSNLGNMHADIGEYATAEGLLTEALDIDRRLPGVDPADLAITINNLATILVDQQKWNEAIALHEESLAIRRAEFGEPSAEVAIALGNYALALGGADRQDDAEVASREAVAMALQIFGADHPRTAISRLRLAEVLIATDRHAEAEPHLRNAVATFTAVDPSYGPTGAARSRLGEALIGMGRGAEGIRELAEGWAIVSVVMGAETPSVQRVAAAAARYHESRNEPALAAEWRSRAGTER
ncbi:MAG: serine/threonine-protein kinase [Longimicrobiales bacterium]